MMTRQKHEKGALNTPFYAKFGFRIWTRYVISFSETTQLLPRLFVRFNDNYVRVSLWLLGFLYPCALLHQRGAPVPVLLLTPMLLVGNLCCPQPRQVVFGN